MLEKFTKIKWWDIALTDSFGSPLYKLQVAGRRDAACYAFTISSAFPNET